MLLILLFHLATCQSPNTRRNCMTDSVSNSFFSDFLADFIVQTPSEAADLDDFDSYYHMAHASEDVLQFWHDNKCQLSKTADNVRYRVAVMCFCHQHSAPLVNVSFMCVGPY